MNEKSWAMSEGFSLVCGVLMSYKTVVLKYLRVSLGKLSMLK